MYSEKKRKDIDTNLKVMQLEFLRLGIKFMPWYLLLAIILIIYELFFDKCTIN
jgi:hypothetical protein